METAEIDRLVMKPTQRRRLGKYVLLARLGHGGMGKIYLGYAPGPAGIEKLLVVKRLHSHLTSDQVLVNSFLDEARLSMALNHPNIVHTYDVGDVDGRYFMVMEFIDGQNLGVLLRTAKRSGAYPSSALWAGMFLSVLDGLHAAHIAKDARGRHLQIIHRDVSPQNILINYEGLPKLVDFGIAKAAMRVSETDAGVLKGKYAYMSPEQVRGDPLDPRSDVFAAGIVLWEMLAGRRLYKADTIVRSVERILTEPPISPVRVNAECDPEIAKVAFKALQKDREQRYASAAELKEALDEALRKQAARTRQSDVRDLMHKLFSDVIERQRLVLEACLNQVESADPALDDDDPERRASDSESDVSLSSLHDESHGSEVTTPSAVRGPSPLVTGEGEPRPSDHPPIQPLQSTSLERKTRSGSAGSGKRGVVNDSAAAPTVPQPAAPGALTTSAPSPRPNLAAQFAEPEATATQSNAPPARRPAMLWGAAGIVIGLGIVVGLVIAFGPPGATSPPPTTASLAPPAPPASVPAPAPPVSTPATTATDAAPPSTAPPTTAPADEPAIALEDGKKRKPRAPRPTTPRDRDEPKPSGTGTGSGTERASEPDKSAGPGASATDVKEMGTLSLDTVPWTVVYLGKKKLGETPLVKVPVPAGSLELTLVNADENVREAYIATVKPGQDYKTRLDLR